MFLYQLRFLRDLAYQSFSCCSCPLTVTVMIQAEVHTWLSELVDCPPACPQEPPAGTGVKGEDDDKEEGDDDDEEGKEGAEADKPSAAVVVKVGVEQHGLTYTTWVASCVCHPPHHQQICGRL
jgi:hypothetical protein